jgi:hypothetical protein
MQVRDFKGKRVRLDEIETMAGSNCFYEAGDYDEAFAVAVVALTDFNCEITDRFGYSDYSLGIFLDGDRIVSLERVGHVHMCGGQGMDSELRRYPHKTLEREAKDKLMTVLSKL